MNDPVAGCFRFAKIEHGGMVARCRVWHEPGGGFAFVFLEANPGPGSWDAPSFALLCVQSQDIPYKASQDITYSYWLGRGIQRSTMVERWIAKSISRTKVEQ